MSRFARASPLIVILTLSLTLTETYALETADDATKENTKLTLKTDNSETAVAIQKHDDVANSEANEETRAASMA